MTQENNVGFLQIIIAHHFNEIFIENYKKKFPIKKDAFYHKYFLDNYTFIRDRGIFLLDKKNFSNQINVALVLLDENLIITDFDLFIDFYFDCEIIEFFYFNESLYEEQIKLLNEWKIKNPEKKNPFLFINYKNFLDFYFEKRPYIREIYFKNTSPEISIFSMASSRFSIKNRFKKDPLSAESLIFIENLLNNMNEFIPELKNENN